MERKVFPNTQYREAVNFARQHGTLPTKEKAYKDFGKKGIRQITVYQVVYGGSN